MSISISVVVPVYNKAYSVERCLISVVSQSYLPSEIIVINDGSTDDSLLIVKSKFKKEIEQGLIKVVDKKNEGVSIARNLGVELSGSDYICFLDADDEWENEFIEKMYHLILDFPDAVMYSLAHRVVRRGNEPIIPKHGLPAGFRGYVNDFFRSSAKGSVINSSKVCVKKTAFNSVGGFPQGVVAGEDLHLWILLALNGRVASEVNFQAVVHQETDNSREARKNSVPYPLHYYSFIAKKPKSLSLDYYLFIVFIKHFASSILKCRFKEAYLRLNSYVKMYFKF